LHPHVSIAADAEQQALAHLSPSAVSPTAGGEEEEEEEEEEHPQASSGVGPLRQGFNVAPNFQKERQDFG